MLVPLLVSCIIFSLQTNEDPHTDWSLEIEFQTNSAYVWRGLVLVDDYVYQPSATFSIRGLSASIWGNLELTDINDYGEGYGDGSGKFTEIDLSVDYSWSLDVLNFAVGFIHYQFPNTPFSSTNEIYGSLGLDVAWSPSIKVYQDVDQAEGTYVTFAVSNTVFEAWRPSESVSISAGIDAWVSYGSTRFNRFYHGTGAGAFTDAGLSLSLPVSVGEGWAFVPSANYSILLDDSIREDSDKPDIFWFGIGLSHEF